MSCRFVVQDPSLAQNRTVHGRVRVDHGSALELVVRLQGRRLETAGLYMQASEPPPGLHAGAPAPSFVAAPSVRAHVLPRLSARRLQPRGGKGPRPGIQAARRNQIDIILIACMG